MVVCFFLCLFLCAIRRCCCNSTWKWNNAVRVKCGTKIIAAMSTVSVKELSVFCGRNDMHISNADNNSNNNENEIQLNESKGWLVNRAPAILHTKYVSVSVCKCVSFVGINGSRLAWMLHYSSTRCTLSLSNDHWAKRVLVVKVVVVDASFYSHLYTKYFLKPFFLRLNKNNQ